MTDLDLKRFYVKICAGPAAGGNPCIYHNTGFTFNQFMKWQWYFNYRAALYKIQHPRHYVDISTGSYDYVPPKEEQIKRLKDKITAKKATITKYENLVRLAKKTWDQLFPLEEEPSYKRAVAKIEKAKQELSQLQTELL